MGLAGSGEEIFSSITKESAEALALAPSDEVVTVIRASDGIIGKD